MKHKRRNFIKLAGLTGLGMAGGFNGFTAGASGQSLQSLHMNKPLSNIADAILADENISLIGAYGKWAAGLIDSELPSLSFRRKEKSNIKTYSIILTYLLGAMLAGLMTFVLKILLQ